MHEQLTCGYSKKQILTVLLVVLTLLLFVGGPGHYSSRIYRNVWDLGHIVLFLVISISLFNLSFIERKRPVIQITIVLFAVIFLAVLTELLQLGSNRTPELADVRRDIIGAFIGSLIVYKQNKVSNKVFPVLVFIAFILTVFEFIALTKTLVDEYEISNTGPILSNLEGTFEEERWKGNSQYELNSDFVIEGEKSLKVSFNTDPYSGITLKYMYRDWSDKDSLHISIFYTDDDDLMLNVRINDFLHVENNRYNDRYNKIITLAKGWNHVNFLIINIKNAPEGRKTNIENMQSIGMFVTNLSAPKTIYIDNIYLN